MPNRIRLHASIGIATLSEGGGISHKSVKPPLNHYRFLRGFDMPRTHAPNDVAAKNRTIASHSWTRQVQSTEKFLRDRVLTVDVCALRREATGTVDAPLSAENSIKA